MDIIVLWYFAIRATDVYLRKLKKVVYDNIFEDSYVSVCVCIYSVGLYDSSDIFENDFSLLYMVG